MFYNVQEQAILRIEISKSGRQQVVLQLVATVAATEAERTNPRGELWQAVNRYMGHDRGWEEAASAISCTFIELKTCNVALLEADDESWEE
nr:hypothetical protein [Tanacetum cinerariifolium]